MAIWVTALSVLLIVCLGDFSAQGEDVPEITQQLIEAVDTKIDDSVDTLKQFFQSNKRSLGQRVRRSWWGDNKDWIVPVAKAGLQAYGRDVSSAVQAAAVRDAEFFQSNKRSLGQRVRRSWWSDNKDWIVPIASAGLQAAGRDVSSAEQSAAVRDAEFFQSNKRSLGQRARRSWWSDNKDWIVPVSRAELQAAGRDASSAERSAAVPDAEFFQSNKRSLGQRVRRSWWSDNKDWIVPVASRSLKAAGRDVSSAEQSAAVPDAEVSLTGENIDNINEAVDFLQKLVNIATDDSQGQ